MEDYRGRAKESPWVWCPSNRKLVPSSHAKTIMLTVYHVDRAGIWPWGICTKRDGVEDNEGENERQIG